jgi:erythromycin esterase-like protein
MGALLVKKRSSPIDAWVDEHAVRLDPIAYEPIPEHANRLAAIDALFDGAAVVFLGETNHFVHEKAEFRTWWLRRLAMRHRLVVGEELGWSDGRDVARYLADGDEAHLERLATFGDTRHVRTDRDDRPTGVLRASFDAYPTALFRAEQIRFYRSLRRLRPARYFGIDIDAAGAGYEDIDIYRHRAGAASLIDQSFWSALVRVPGESIGDEAKRLEHALDLLPDTGSPVIDDLRQDLRALIETLHYTVLAHHATDYEALRPAMAYRETAMKRRLEWILGTLADDEALVLMGHAFHLAKDDDALGHVGVGPGGDQVHSLGHHLVQTLGLTVRSVWFLYGGGEDSQPFPDLPNTANYPRKSLNAQLAKHDQPLVIPLEPAAGVALERDVGVGHMYNLVVPVHLPSQADAIFFIPRVTPLRA